MFFRKHNIKKQKRKENFLAYGLGTIGIFFVFFIGIQAINFVHGLEFKFLNSKAILNNSEAIVTDEDTLVNNPL